MGIPGGLEEPTKLDYESEGRRFESCRARQGKWLFAAKTQHGRFLLRSSVMDFPLRGCCCVGEAVSEVPYCGGLHAEQDVRSG